MIAAANSTKDNLTEQDERLVRAMHLLGDVTRYKMFRLLLSNSSLCVSQIANELNVSTPAVSQHFRIFELLGLVDKHRFGQKICYMLKSDDLFVNKLMDFVAERK
jgi:predicted transcriptional regulator